MRKTLTRALVAAFGCGALVALAVPAAASAQIKPAYTSNCTIGTSYCSILSNWPVDSNNQERWLYGTDHNEKVISFTSSDTYTFNADPGESPWGYLQNSINGECLEESGGNVWNESCTGASAELFWLDQAGGSNYPNSAYAIKSWTEGRTLNMLVGQTSGNYVTFVDANNDGTAFYSRG